MLLFSARSMAQTVPSAPAPAKPGAQTPGTQNVQPPNEPARRGGFVPGQKRPPGDPVQIARGKTLFDINCRGCHGADLRGGDLGGPNLLRSQVALSDQNGELIVPIIHGSRQNMGMPAIELNDADANAVAAYVRSVIETIQGQGALRPPGENRPAFLSVMPAKGKPTLRQSAAAAIPLQTTSTTLPAESPIPSGCKTLGWLAARAKTSRKELHPLLAP